MIKNYLKIAWRNLVKDRAFSVINIAGLAIGMASAVLILLWIQSEISFDQFHQKKDRVYEAWNRVKRDGTYACWNVTPTVLAKTLKKDFPEVEHAVRVNWTQQYLFSVGQKRIMGDGNIVDSNFLELFSFPLLQGDPSRALLEPTSILLTQKMARRLFGTEDAMGRTITLDNQYTFKVTGILQDLPPNTRFKFDCLVPWSAMRQAFGEDEYWGNNSTATYVLLKERVQHAAIDAKIKHLRRTYDKEDPDGELFLYPMTRWRLYSRFENGIESGGLIEFVRLFGLVALIILLIACINFMNLSTARSEKRAKEVGIRKVAGARRGALIGQFLGESVLIACLAGILALLIVELALPAFSQLTERSLEVQYGHWSFWGFFLGFMVFTGLLAGSYPAFFLSSFQPIRVLKGTLSKVNGSVTPRKVLVILQFCFAIILTISTIVVHQQIRHARDRQMGYNKDGLLYHMMTGDLGKHYPAIKHALLTSGVAKSVTKTSSPVTESWSNSWGFEWPGKVPGDKTVFDRYVADDRVAETMGLKIIAGRDFDITAYPTDSSAIILNESAVLAMGLKEPIGQIIRDNGREWHIVGVVKDFVIHSPYRKTEPMVIEGAHGWFNVIHIKLNGARNTAENLSAVERLFKQYNPEYPFEYKFVDEQYGVKFEQEQRIGKLAGLFTFLTILISCLGLFGLATYMAEARIKEIGVRKVLGATVTDITALLSRDFLKLVGIALLIAIPIAWWATHRWLQDYEYRVDIRWWYFALAGLAALVIALLTVSWQALRAAFSNPVKSLRSE